MVYIGAVRSNAVIGERLGDGGLAEVRTLGPRAAKPMRAH